MLLLAILLGALSAGRAQRLPEAARGRRDRGARRDGADVGAGDGRARDRARAAGAARGHHRRPRGRGPLRRQLLARRRGSTTSTGSSSCARGSHRRIAAGSALAFAGLGFTAVYPRGLRDRPLLPGALDLRDGPRALRRARLRHRRDRARRGRLHGAQARPADPGEADAHRRRGDAAAALGHVRRQRRALAAGRRLGLDHAGPVRLGAAADLPRRADRHPSDPRGPDRAGRAAGGLHRSVPPGSSRSGRGGAAPRRRSSA